MRAVMTLSVPGSSSAGRALESMRGHVVHAAVETLLQPGQQAGFRRRKIDIGHADLGESQFSAPGLDLRDELSSIDHQTPL